MQGFLTKVVKVAQYGVVEGRGGRRATGGAQPFCDNCAPQYVFCDEAIIPIPRYNMRKAVDKLKQRRKNA